MKAVNQIIAIRPSTAKKQLLIDYSTSRIAGKSIFNKSSYVHAKLFLVKSIALYNNIFVHKTVFIDKSFLLKFGSRTLQLFLFSFFFSLHSAKTTLSSLPYSFKKHVFTHKENTSENSNFGKLSTIVQCTLAYKSDAGISLSVVYHIHMTIQPQYPCRCAG